MKLFLLLRKPGLTLSAAIMVGLPLFAFGQAGSNEPAPVAVSTTSGTVLAANPSRLTCTITNDGTTGCYLSETANAVAHRGFYLAPNGGTFNMDGTNRYLGVITAVTATGSTTLVIHEGQ